MLTSERKIPASQQTSIKCKKVFLKSPSRIRLFYESTPNLTLPPEPVITRWGTWISACTYYWKNFDVVKSVVDSFDRSSAASIGISQDLLADSEIKGSLAYINGNFSFLPITITWLEKRDGTIHSVV